MGKNSLFLGVGVTFLVIALAFTLLLSLTSAYATDNIIKSVTKLSSSPKVVRFAVAGDWSCNPTSQRTVYLIKDNNPDLVLALGDFSYQKGTGCWFKIMSPLVNKTKIVIGEHDYDTNTIPV